MTLEWRVFVYPVKTLYDSSFSPRVLTFYYILSSSIYEYTSDKSIQNTTISSSVLNYAFRLRMSLPGWTQAQKNIHKPYLSDGLFPGVWILCADASEPSVCSVFIGPMKNRTSCSHDLWRWNRQGCSVTSAYKIQTPGNNPKERIKHSKNGESLKPRIYIYTRM